MIFIRDPMVAYMAVPKSACSSVKAALADLDKTNAYTSEQLATDVNPHAVYQTQRFQEKRWKRSEGAYRFTVVRDPLKRLLSVYTNRVLQMRDLQSAWGVQKSPDLTPNPDPSYFFENLERYRRASSSIKHHTFPQYMFTGLDFSLYDKVYRTNELGELATKLTALNGGQKVSMPRANSSSAKLTFDDLSSQARDVIVPFLKRDYDDFGQMFENPFD